MQIRALAQDREECSGLEWLPIAYCLIPTGTWPRQQAVAEGTAGIESCKEQRETTGGRAENQSTGHELEERGTVISHNVEVAVGLILEQGKEKEGHTLLTCIHSNTQDWNTPLPPPFLSLYLTHN